VAKVACVGREFSAIIGKQGRRDHARSRGRCAWSSVQQAECALEWRQRSGHLAPPS
jgi:hypothetical protein